VTQSDAEWRQSDADATTTRRPIKTSADVDDQFSPEKIFESSSVIWVATPGARSYPNPSKGSEKLTDGLQKLRDQIYLNFDTTPPRSQIVHLYLVQLFIANLKLTLRWAPWFKPKL